MEWLNIIQGPIDYILSDLHSRSRSLEVKRSNTFYANNFVQSCHTESRQNHNIASSILEIILNIIMAVGLPVSKIDRCQRSEGSGHSEMDYNWLKLHFRTIELECVLNGCLAIRASNVFHRKSHGRSRVTVITTRPTLAICFTEF